MTDVRCGQDIGNTFGSILLAQFPKIPGPQRPERKLYFLFHRLTFFPGHDRGFYLFTAQKCYLCLEPIVLPMS